MNHPTRPRHVMTGVGLPGIGTLICTSAPPGFGPVSYVLTDIADHNQDPGKAHGPVGYVLAKIADQGQKAGTVRGPIGYVLADIADQNQKVGTAYDIDVRKRGAFMPAWCSSGGGW